MVEAYVLITAAIGKVRQAVQELQRVKGVKSARVVTGPYDIIALIEAKDLAALTNAIVGRIHKIKGIVDTNTAIVVE